MGITIAQAASTLNVSEKTIRRRIKNGVIQASLVGNPARYEIAADELGSGQNGSA